MAVFSIGKNSANQDVVLDPQGNIAVIRADDGTSITIVPSAAIVNKLNTEYAKGLRNTSNDVRASLEQAINVLKMSGENTGTSGGSSGGSSGSSPGSRLTTGQNTGASVILGGVENNADFTVADYEALTARMTLLINAASLYAKLYGYLVTPITDPVTGNVTGYDPVLDNGGKQIPTQEAIKQGYDIDKIIVDNEVARAGATGKIKDPSDPTGNRWINTPASMLTLAQTNYANAQTDEVRNNIRVKNQELLSSALADPNRFVEGYTKANLSGTRLQGTAAAASRVAASNQVPAGINATGGVINSLSAETQSQVSPGMEVNQANIDALRGSIQLPVSANVDAALQGKYVGNAASVSDLGTAGIKTLDQINPASGNYAKINPIVYNNLDPVSQGQYNSLALANQGIDKDTMKKTIAGQLGGSSGGVPAAFRLR